MGLARAIGLGLTIVLASTAPRLRLDSASRPDQVSEAPLWIDASGQPNERARQALAIIADATGHGLNPADYRPPESALAGGARFESQLTLGLSRYLQDLRQGRVDPRALGLKIETRADVLDVHEALRQAVAAGRLGELVSEQASQSNQYRSLQVALVTYRALAADTTLPRLSAIKSAIHPGEPYAEAPALHARLVALGDILPGTPPPVDAMLTDSLVEGLRRFQVRHGLTDDGVLGKRTLAELQIPLTSRVRQIELALERLRWLPRVVQGRVLVVNIPMFRLWALEADSSVPAPPVTMKVIVGRAMRTRTPIFTADLKAVILRPYWNVPLSIARGEVVPKIRRDPHYMARNHFEIVRGDGDDAAIVPATPEALDQVARGTLRIRQRPGPDNSLGLIKFDFPNPFTVYMHGTPAVQLFNEDRRDFSHGCVRIEDPVTLAQWVLDDPMWTREAIIGATGDDDTNGRPVTVTRPTRVWLFYTTVVVHPEGPILFAPDIYGHDEVLTRALRTATKM